MLWGAAPMSVPIPDILSGSFPLIGFMRYPVYRVVIIAAGLLTALGLYLLVNHTRVGMLLRAGATNGPMVSALGVDIKRLFMLVFGARGDAGRLCRRNDRADPVGRPGHGRQAS